MDELLLDNYLRKWEPELARVNKPLVSWNPNIDFNKPDWVEKMKAAKSPLETDEDLKKLLIK